LSAELLLHDGVSALPTVSYQPLARRARPLSATIVVLAIVIGVPPEGLDLQ
jgi:hypothetical protein